MIEISDLILAWRKANRDINNNEVEFYSAT